MPLTIPPFVQYQQPLVPLRSINRVAAPEGDYFINFDIVWLTSPPGNSVQFALAGNSPVALSQISALSVDNSRSGADVAFQFPDSGFELVVPARFEVITPVFTNALMFYAFAASAVAGDETIFQVHNYVPRPLTIAPSTLQNHASIAGENLVNGSTVLVPAGISGTLNTIALNLDGGSVAGIANVILQDGTGRQLWVAAPQFQANGAPLPINVTGLSIRFVNGVNAVISGSTLTGGLLIANVYYSTP